MLEGNGNHNLKDHFELIKAVQDNNKERVSQLINAKVTYDLHDKSLLDLALIHNSHLVAHYLEKQGCPRLLSDEKIRELTSQYTEGVQGCVFKLTVQREPSGLLGVLAEKIDLETKKRVGASQIEVDFEDDAALDTALISVAAAKGKKCIALKDPDSQKQVIALFEIEMNGHVKVHQAQMRHHSLHIQTISDINILNPINGKSFDISSHHFKIDKQGAVGCHRANLQVSGDVTHEGQLRASYLKTNAQNFENLGKIEVTHLVDINLQGSLEQKGLFSAFYGGSVHAHSITNHLGNTIVTESGVLKLYGQAKLDNQGALIGEHFQLSSRHLVANRVTGMIKAKTCIVPNTTQRFANGGIFLVGRSVQPSMIENLLNYGKYGVTALNLLGLIPVTAVMKTKSILLYTQTLYQGSKLFKAVYEGNQESISQQEWAQFVLSHVLPSLGSLMDESVKTHFLCTLLYQIFGWNNSEADIIDKAIGLLELMIRGCNVLGESYISDSNLELLENTAFAIRNSKQYLKYAQSMGEILHAHYTQETLAMQNAQVTLETISEGLMRDFLHALSPVKLFNVELSPKDLGLFILDKGHQLDSVEQFHRVIYGSLYALSKSDCISQDTKNWLQYSIHLGTGFMPSAKNAMDKFARGELKYQDTMHLVLKELASFAQFKAQYNSLQAKKNEQFAQKQMDEAEVVEVEQSTNIDDMHEEQVAPEEIHVDTYEEVLNESVQLGPENVQTETVELEPPTPEENQKIIDENAEKVHVQYDPIHFDLALNVQNEVDKIMDPFKDDSPIEESTDSFANSETMEEAKLAQLYQQPSWQDWIAQKWGAGIQQKHAQALNELMRVVNKQGEGAMQGHLGVLADIFQNHGLLNTAGNIAISFVNAQNTNLIKASNTIDLIGLDVNDRDEHQQLKDVNLDSDGVSSFINDESGYLKADGEIASRGVGTTVNKGSIQASSYQTVYGSRKHANSGFLNTQDDITVRATDKAHNSGYMVGKNIHHEGTLSGDVNDGKMIAQEKITHSSRHETTQTEQGESIAKTVHFEGNHISKKGVTKATLVTISGENGIKPQSLELGNGEEDQIIGMEVNAPTESFTMDPKAFHGTLFSNLDIDESMLGIDRIIDLEPDFNNVLQVTIPGTNSTFSLTQLPQLGEEGTFIFNAPGSTLEAISDEKFHYKGTLTFLGDTYYQQGEQGFDKAAFDVHVFNVEGGESLLTLSNGGVIQADLFDNQGHLESDGIVHWNVQSFANEAQLKDVLRQFQHSKQIPSIDLHFDKQLVQNSGTIQASGHRGFIGQFNQAGGKFLSKDEGTFIYTEDSHQKAIFSTHSEYSTGNIEDKGCSWHFMPQSHESVVGSTGATVLLGTGQLKATGMNLYGDQGVQTHFNQGIDDDNRDSAFYFKPEAVSRERGKNHIVVHREEGYVYSQNEISSNYGNIQAGSSQGGIHLSNVVLATPGDVQLIAKNKVTIEGQEYHTQLSSQNSQHTWRGKKTSKTHTDRVDVVPSLVMVGGDMKVSCLEFNLGSIVGNIEGDVDVTALVTDLYGLDESYNYESTVKSFSIGLPTDRLKGILDNHNARAIFSSLIQSCGWDAQSLKALVNAQSPQELPGNLVTFAKGAWDLTALVASASNDLMDGDKKGFITQITEQLGLTTKDSNGQVVLNTKVHFNLSQTTETTSQTTKKSTNLYIGGNFKLQGNKLFVRDGSQISAENLILALAEGIEFTANKTTTEHTVKTKTASVGVNLLDPKQVDVAGSRSRYNSVDVDYDLAGLEGRSGAYVAAGSKISGEGRIKAPTGVIRAPEINLTSKQSTHDESYKSIAASVSTDVSSFEQGCGSFNQSNFSNQSAQTKEMAGIDIGSGIIQTNQVHLENGAELKSGKLEREDGQIGLPEVTGSAAHDFNQTSQSSFGFSGAFDGSDGFGQISRSRDEEGIIHNPTVIAGNINPGDLAGINTDPSLQHVQQKPKHSGISLAYWKPNENRLESQKKDIEKFGEHINQGAKKALHFMFGDDGLKSAGMHSESNPFSGSSELDKEVIEELMIDKVIKNQEKNIQSDSESSKEDLNEGKVFVDVSEFQWMAEEQSNALGMSTHKGLERIFDLPEADVFLDNMPFEDLLIVANIVQDLESGIINPDLNRILNTQIQQQGSSLIDKLDKMLNPIGTAHAEPATIAVGAVALLTALGIIVVNSKGVPSLRRNSEQDLEDYWQKLQVEKDKDLLNTKTTFPAKDDKHPESSSINGHDPQLELGLSRETPFPLHEDLEFTHYEHPIVEQKSLKEFIYDFPTEPLLGVYLYFKSSQIINKKLEEKINHIELPTHNNATNPEFVYTVPKKHKNSFIPKGRMNGREGYKDGLDNVWVKGPCHEHGASAKHEWDVQLSTRGKNQLKHIIGNADYANVSTDGRVRRVKK